MAGYLAGLPADLRSGAVTLVNLARQAQRDTQCSASGWQPADPGQVLAEGRQWALAQGSLPQLAGLLGRVTEEAAEAVAASPAAARRLVRTADRLLQLAVDGFCSVEQPSARQCAGDVDLRALLTGDPVDTGGLSPAYAVLAFHTDAPAGVIGELAGRSRADGALTIYFPHCGVMLIPAGDTDQAAKQGAELCRTLGIASTWAGLAWCPLAELRDNWPTALDVLIGALAAHLPAGPYQLSEVPLPAAVLAQPVVTQTLERVLKPVLDQPPLHQALVAFLRFDGNRSRAAGDLRVHRSTLDYRLARIAGLTGQDPQTLSGNRTLSLALLAQAARRVTGETLAELVALRPAAKESAARERLSA